MLLVLILSISRAFAGGQYLIKDYKTARSEFLFTQLYVNSGESLYCGTSIPFPETEKLTGEHVYAADWMASHFGCDSRMSCSHLDYKRAEADLHNLWPEIGRINSSRNSLFYAEIDDSLNARRHTHLCLDFERTSSSSHIGAKVEPRDSAKGNIARSIFYMHVEYGLPLYGMKTMLKKWNRTDPPGEHEYWRNERIFELQGIRNKFIDNFHLINSL